MAVIVCEGCNTLNNVPQLSENSVPKCGRCGRYLTAVDAVVEKTVRGSDRTTHFTSQASSNFSSSSGARQGSSAASSSQDRPKQATAPRKPSEEEAISKKIAELNKKATRTSKGAKVFFWVVGLFVVLPLFVELAGSKPASRPSTPRQAAVPAVPAAPLPPPVAQQHGLMRNYTGASGVAPLEVRTDADEDYYLKLVDAVTGQDRLTYFIRGGVPLNVEVPLGSYRMRYASGKVWYGEQALFGPDGRTSYAEAGSVFHFRSDFGRYTGYTVTLIKQVNGNLSTRNISASNF